jgi:hypothetical protein
MACRRQPTDPKGVKAAHRSHQLFTPPPPNLPTLPITLSPLPPTRERTKSARTSRKPSKRFVDTTRAHRSPSPSFAHSLSRCSRLYLSLTSSFRLTTHICRMTLARALPSSAQPPHLSFVAVTSADLCSVSIVSLDLCARFTRRPRGRRCQ